MIIVRKNQTKEFKNNDQCVGFEFPLGDKNIDAAIYKLSGRYPNKGRVVNTKCKELIYVTKGQGKIVVGGKEYLLSPKDLILIDPNEPYYWEGDLEMFVSCTPAWFPEQHKEVD